MRAPAAWPEEPRVLARLAHEVEPGLDGVAGGEGDPVVGARAQRLDGGAHGLGVGAAGDLDRGQQHGLGALRPQRLGEARGLPPRARDQHAPARERAAQRRREALAQRDDLADDEQRRRLHPGVARRSRDLLQRRLDHALARRCRLDDQRARRRGRASALDQRAGDALKAADAHQHDERVGRRRQLRPAHLRGGLGGVLVAGDDSEAGGDAAVRHRDAGRGHPADRRGHPRHDGRLEARVRERLEFLATAAEDERVAALEAHDALARARVLDERGVDLLLRHRHAAWRLAGVDALRVIGAGVEQRRGGEAVVEHDLGLAQRLQAALRHEARIARSRADEPDVAGLGLRPAHCGSSPVATVAPSCAARPRPSSSAASTGPAASPKRAPSPASSPIIARRASRPSATCA